MQIEINKQHPRRYKLYKRLVSNLANVIERGEKKQMEYISFTYCTDRFLLTLNQKYLDHETYTDIITFQLNTKKEPIRGDIYISLDRVRENARKRAVNYRTELLRVSIHGLLHLCGYKDKRSADIAIMREKEDEYLSKIY